MVLNVRFVPKSLLYGYSCMWLIIQQVQVFCYLLYLATIIFIHLEVQKTLLGQYGITRETELSYKAIYYAPILQRICLFILSSATALDFRNIEWLLYDKYDIFSFDRSSQKRLYMLILLVALPDGVFCHLETNNFMTIVPPGIDHLIRLFIILASILSFSVRYKPLLNVIYSANCVKSHLKTINDQIVITDAEFSKRLSFSPPENQVDALERGSRAGSPLWSVSVNTPNELKSDYGGQVNDHARHRSANYNLPLADGHRSRATSLNDSYLMDRYSGKSGSDLSSSPISSRWLGNNLIYMQDVASATGKVGAIGVDSNGLDGAGRQVNKAPGDANTIGGANKGGDRGQVCIIRNLHQLEHHITRLSFFVGDMDRCSAEIVFSISFLIFIQFIYSAFFMIEFSKNSSQYSHMLLGIIAVFTRLTIPLYLFLSGDQMEKQAKKLLTNLEIIYLRDSSQSLIYKQYGSHTMASLARIIKLLKSIRFNCDGTMNINLATMKRFILYAVTTMFIVVQYDALNVSHETPDEALANGTSSSAS